jgi:hypothetical protein
MSDEDHSHANRVAVIGGRGWAAALATLLASRSAFDLDVLPPELRYPARLKGERIPLPSPEAIRCRDDERRERRRRADDRRERLLRERIAEGRDDRPDKYLHSSARRRRASQGIEAEGQDPKGLGASHESPVGEADAPVSPSPQTNPLGSNKE